MFSGRLKGAYQRLPTAELEQRWHRARMSRSIMRFVCFALIALLAFMMLGLVRMSMDSTKHVEELLAAKNAGLDWHGFPLLQNYFRGLRYLVREQANTPEYPEKGEVITVTNPEFDSYAFSPYPLYDSREYLEKYEPVKECFLFENSTVRIPPVQSYRGIPSGFPDPLIGSYSILGLDSDTCFDRFGRFGPYGYGYPVKKGGNGLGLKGHRTCSEKVWKNVPAVDYSKVDWADAQARCAAANTRRFREPHAQHAAPISDISKKNRTAIIIRTWHTYNYRPEDIMNLRALVAELSLHSAGEYSIHLLVHMKDHNIPIWASDDIYQKALNDSVPAEFRGLATLWSEAQMELLYPGLNETNFKDLPVHGVYRSSWMPLQYFAYNHPEYDFFWNWELDVRYTGHFYDLFEKIATWARIQPRKGLWERSGRFYIPEVHGTWKNYSDMVTLQTERLALRRGYKKSTAQFVWGPVKFHDSDKLDRQGDPSPPWPYEQDRNEWGVGEDADVIVLNPIFDPEESGWGLTDDTTGYNDWDYPKPPRRTAIVATSRLSRRLLLKMHMETAVLRHSMTTEMWPLTVSLHHSLKAVYAPHPFYVDRKWPLEYANHVFNGGADLVPGGSNRHIFGEAQIHNLGGVSWYYNAFFPQQLWRRWLGYIVEDQGGERFEMGKESGGRMCLRSMLLHPVKDG
jgi:hypothetical protein